MSNPRSRTRPPSLNSPDGSPTSPPHSAPPSSASGLGFFQSPAKRSPALPDDLSQVVIVIDCDGVLTNWPGVRVFEGSALFNQIKPLLQDNRQAEALQRWQAAANKEHPLHEEYEGIRFHDDAIVFLRDMLSRGATVCIDSSNHTPWLMFQVAQAGLDVYLASGQLTIAGKEQTEVQGKSAPAQDTIEAYKTKHEGQLPAITVAIDDNEMEAQAMHDGLMAAGVSEDKLIFETPKPGQVDVENIKRQIVGRLSGLERSAQSTPSPPPL